MWLDKLLEDFFLFIRNKKFLITVNDKLLIFNAITFIDISNSEQLYSLLSSLIVKEEVKLIEFRELFDIFFKNIDFKKKDNVEYDDLNNSDSNNSLLDGVVSSYKFKKYDYGTTLKYFILNDKRRLDRLMRLAVSNLDNINIGNSGNSFNKVKNFLNIEKLEEDIKIFKKEMLNSGADRSEVDLIVNKIINNLKNFKKKIRVELKSNLSFKKSTQEIEIADLDIKNLEEICKKIVKRLNQKKSKRYKNARKGILDTRKTIHKSICYNQIPLKRIYKKQKKKKRNLVILTDISDSVKKHSQIILYFIYSLNKFFKMIRTFTFIADIEEITTIFKEDLSFKDLFYKINTKGGNSDYNSVFEIFLDGYTDILTKNTIFIIIGDARNNYLGVEIKNLISIQKKVKEIIWLNPESEFLWGSADSNMDIYKKTVKKVYQVKTIEDIEKFALDVTFK